MKKTKMNNVVIDEIRKTLFSMQDVTYGDFIFRLTPTVDRENIIGVRVPLLRQIAKKMSTDDKKEFLSQLPHFYYEENLIHGFIIQNIKEFDDCINEVNRFLPFVDNWAVSDTMMPKCFAKNTDVLLTYIDKWISSKETYSIRFGIDVLMNLYLDDKFDEKYVIKVLNVKSDEYYVKMMKAWYFATALAKQYNVIIDYFKRGLLDTWTHNKAIQKAIESFRISNEIKDNLRKLKK